MFLISRYLVMVGCFCLSVGQYSLHPQQVFLMSIITGGNNGR